MRTPCYGQSPNGRGKIVVWEVFNFYSYAESYYEVVELKKGANPDAYNSIDNVKHRWGKYPSYEAAVDAAENLHKLLQEETYQH